MYRGANKMSRAQTVQILVNSMVLEIVVLCMQYAEASETVELDFIYVASAGFVAAAITIPAMMVFAMAFAPQIFFNLAKKARPPAALGAPRPPAPSPHPS